MINSLDAVNQNIRQDEHLILYNDLDEIDVFANVTEDIIQGVVMVNHGYWMRHINGKTVNALISNKPVSYTHLRAHETRHDLVCRLLLEKKK